MVNELKKRLKGKIVVVGIGNPLRGDDGAGPALICQLKSGTQKTNPLIELIDAGEVPENYLSKIATLKPDTVVLVDAADFDAPPGTMKIISPQDIPERGFSTHTASLKLTIQYLKSETDADIFLLGIQPRSIQLGEGISAPVKKTIDKIVDMIGEYNA